MSKTQSFEGGTNGVDISTSNTGAGSDSPINVARGGSGGTLAIVQFTNSAPIRGTLSARIVCQSGINGNVQYGTTDSAAGHYFEWDYTNEPAGDEIVFEVRTGSAKAVWVTWIAATRKLKVSSGTTSPGDLYTTPSALPTSGKQVGIHLMADAGTTTSNGKVQFGVYSLAGAFVAGMSSEYQTLTANTSAGVAFAVQQFGRPSTELHATDVKVDAIKVTSGFVSALPSTNTLPTVTGSALQSVAGSTATVAFAATDSDGTIASFTCTVLSNTGTSTPAIGSPTLTGIGTASATASFPITGLGNGVVVFQCTATDNLGGISPTPATAQVNVTSNTPGLLSVTAAALTIVGGGTALQALQAGAPSTRYLQTPAPPAGAGGTLVNQPLTVAAVPVTFWITGRASDASTALTRTVSLKQGSTTIASQSGTLGLTDSPIGRTTTTGETSAITDRSALTVVWSDS